MVKHLWVTPDDISAVIDWRKTNLWRSVDGLHSADGFADKVSRDAAQDGRISDPSRLFFGYDELIVSGGRTYAFSNQSGHRTVEAMKGLVERFPEMGIGFSEHPG